MSEEEIYRRNLMFATMIYRRYCTLMDTNIKTKRNYRNADANLSMWFKMVEQTLKSIPVGRESIKK